MKILFIFLLATLVGIIAQENYKHFVYKLKLQPKYHVDEAWTPEAQSIVWKHYVRLREDMKHGKVIHAGRALDTTSGFGIVIFKARSKQEATEYMNTDPAVKSGIMTATCDEYSLALLRSENAFVLSEENQGQKILFKEILVSVPVREVWQIWTTEKGLAQILETSCKVDLRIGGAISIVSSKHSKYRESGKVLSYIPNKMLSFQWTIFPVSKEEKIYNTFVVIEMSQVAGNITSLRLYHQGWSETSSEIYQDYEEIWGTIFQKLQKNFEKNN